MKKFIIIAVVIVLLLLVLKGLPAKRKAAYGPGHCLEKATCSGKNPLIKNVTVFQQNGGRARFSPDSQSIVFDRKESDGYYQIYLANLSGKITANLTKGKQGINQRNNGNPVFDPNGKYIVFVSEENRHLYDTVPAEGDPGVGLFSNLWATTPDGSQFWQLTNIPIKQTLTDGIPAMAVVNPLFSLDGSQLVWTERYAETPGQCNDNWGKWRLMIGNFNVTNGVPHLTNQRVFYQPIVTKTNSGYDTGDYVTALSFLDNNTLIVAGNLSGQHPYGMDQYKLDVATGQVTDLTNTPNFWEEDSNVTPMTHQLIYMSNRISSTYMNICQKWTGQQTARDYFMMNSDGSNNQRLTYFNDPTAPEYAGQSTDVDQSSISPDGKYLVGIFHWSNDSHLQNLLIQFSTPQ